MLGFELGVRVMFRIMGSGFGLWLDFWVRVRISV